MSLNSTSIRAIKKTQVEVGLAEGVVLQLTRKIKERNIRLFTDNFYTSPSLFMTLKNDGIYACGTVRANRKGMPRDFKSDKEMKRGDADFRHTHGLYAVKWKDNRSVHVLSTIDGTEMTNVKRRQRGQSEKVNEPCPKMISTYNDGMKGTDLMDQKTKPYCFDRKDSLKYYTKPFYDYLDIPVKNGTSLDVPGTSPLYVPGRPICPHLRTLWDVPTGTSQDVPGTSQDERMRSIRIYSF